MPNMWYGIGEKRYKEKGYEDERLRHDEYVINCQLYKHLYINQLAH